MDVSEARRLLRNLRALGLLVRDEEQFLKWLRRRLEGADGVRLGVEVRGGGGVSVADGAAELVVCEQRAERAFERWAAEVARVYEVVEGVEEPFLRWLLLRRYRDGASWAEVAREACYARSQVHRLHRRALEAAQGVLDGMRK